MIFVFQYVADFTPTFIIWDAGGLVTSASFYFKYVRVCLFFNNNWDSLYNKIQIVIFVFSANANFIFPFGKLCLLTDFVLGRKFSW